MHLLASLFRAPTYRQFERDFSDATLLPLALRPAVVSAPPLNDKPHANTLCRVLGRNAAVCAACVRLQSGLCTGANAGTQTFRCLAGFQTIAVPVPAGSAGTVGFLQTGQVLLAQPTPERLRNLVRRLPGHGQPCARHGMERLESVWKGLPVYSRRQLAAATRLLAVFARQLEEEATAWLAQQAVLEHPGIRRARRFIAEHRDEESLCVADAAAHAHMSVPYFCASFKEGTGQTFTEHLALLRVMEAKRLLRGEPRSSISEIAYRIGFGSLSQFNRTFKEVAGVVPGAYRRAGGRGEIRLAAGSLFSPSAAARDATGATKSEKI